MMSINKKWLAQVINQSHTTNSQDCGEHGLGNVIILRKICMGYCLICANLKSLGRAVRTSMEKDMSKKLLQEHREAQSLERKKAKHHR